MEREEYGFSTYKGGLTTYDGTMTDKEPAKNIAVNDECTEVTYSKKDYSVKLALTWSDDTLTAYKRTVSCNNEQIFSDSETEGDAE